MRSFWIIFLFYFPLILQADWDQLFSDGEDPSLFHHVHVITGNLNVSFNDTMKSSGMNIPLFRTYSSSGALERKSTGLDLLLKVYRRGWGFEGGWSLMPHISLFFEISQNLRETKVCLSEPGGNAVLYRFSHKEDRYMYFKANCQGGQLHGEISGANNTQNNFLRFDFKKKEIILFLPNGGKRIYYNSLINEKNIGQGKVTRLYLLHQEIFPNQHILEYTYDKEKNLNRVTAFGPQRRKEYSHVKFDFDYTKRNLKYVAARTSKGQLVEYHFQSHWSRDYLNKVENKNLPSEVSFYEPSRKGSGVRMNKLSLEDRMQFGLSYYTAPDIEHERKWLEKPHKKCFHIDKVKNVTAPVGEKGEMQHVAKFTYFPNLTEVTDVDNLLIRYHHNDGNLTHIQYYDDQNQIYSSQVFYWDKNRLKCKAKLDKKGGALFAKTFTYDANGNVTEEVLWGNLSGKFHSVLSIDEKGNPSGAEYFRKKYSYDPHFNVVVKEEEGNLTYQYFYKANTNLLTAKITLHDCKIIKREFYVYNEENFLIREILDDGRSTDIEDVRDISLRLETSYEVDPNSGLTASISEWYLDDHKNLQLLKKKELRYSDQQRVMEERIFDAKNNYCYSVHMEYDSYGNIIRKTTPTGEENLYSYDCLGNLMQSKEVGQPTKKFTYNAMNLQTSCTLEENETTSYTFYDAKGRITKEIDGKENIVCHSYDCFGNKLSTKYPPMADRNKNLYSPISAFEYDIHGNLISTTLPQGEKSFQLYNTYRKPIKVIQAEGSQVEHYYNLNGTLAQTMRADGNKVLYEYDYLQRLISKKIYSQSEELLCLEKWTYNTFQLLSYRDNQNVVTVYAYDRAGRKISETVGNRKVHYEYDDLGLVKCVKNDCISSITINDSIGRVIEQWEEDEYGHIKNRMSFFYDRQNKKEKAIRLTTKGEAVDFFKYDFLGRLICHVDPNQAETKIVYKDCFENEFSQKVLQKITIDPLCNRLIETQDVGGRITSIEKQDSQGITVFKEEYFYDRSGNKIERISYVFSGGEITKVISFQMEYDCMGRVTQEIEVKEKVTTYDYNVNGQVVRKVLPNTVALYYKYDSLGRLLELTSSDSSIHYCYTYDLGMEPLEIKDLLQKRSLIRKYNIYGEIVEETSLTGLKYSWEYDNLGRCLAFHLPDNSCISYCYLGMHMSAVIRKDSNHNTLYAHKYAEFDVNGHVKKENCILGLGEVETTHDLLERPVSQRSPYHFHSQLYGISGLVMENNNAFFGKKEYAYDALNQLTQEGTNTYQFDSLGNPSDCIVNHYNQILTTSDGQKLTYDDNGNTVQKSQKNEKIIYQYDAIGRLTDIISSDNKKIHYSYDPLSRLLAKETYLYKNQTWSKVKECYFLYDHDYEIGKIEKENITELKVLGLGIKGDIGAAVAIELNKEVYAPLHDFNGNILAIVSSDRTIAEKYELDAFGKEKPSSAMSLNPWRFCSKRLDEGCIFFGERFYDPSLKRWLTPDPSGFVDGANLYAYVLNSPLNRVDLFGLDSDVYFGTAHEHLKYSFDPNFFINVSVRSINSMPSVQTLFATSVINKRTVDLVVSCGHWHQLQFTPEELKVGKVNILNHLQELTPSVGNQIALASVGNGIMTSLYDCFSMCDAVSREIGGTLCLALYNKTQGLKYDFIRTINEKNQIETPIVAKTRQFMASTSERLSKVNKNAIWLYIPHSENGVITKRSIEGMNGEQQERLQKMMYIFAVGPAEPISDESAFKVYNVYSEKDYITKGFATPFLKDTDYNIKFLTCISERKDRILFTADHMFLAPTYSEAWKGKIKDLREKYGFYTGENNAQMR